MPKWSFHREWSLKVGIPEETCDYVNLLIDFPKEHSELQDFCSKEPSAWVYSHSGKPTKMHIGQTFTHDSARKNPKHRAVQIQFLQTKGDNHLRAFYLHQLLDYIKKRCDQEVHLASNDVLNPKKIANYIGSPEDPNVQYLTSFIKDNWESLSAKITAVSLRCVRN